MHEALDLVATRALEQGLGADDVGLEKGPRTGDRAVHVALGGEVDDRLGSA